MTETLSIAKAGVARRIVNVMNINEFRHQISGRNRELTTQRSYRKQGGHGTGKTGNLVVTFSRQGKHREFYFDTGKNSETQGKYFSVTQGKI